MAPNTRQIDRFTPPPKPQSGGVPNTERRMKFFKAYDKDCKVKSFRAICRDEDEAESTARGWMTQRRNLGLLANRRTRKLSKRLGKPSKITPAMCRMLVDPKQNPVRNQLYDVQIEYHKLPVQKRQLQRKLREHTNGGRRYKMAFVKKRVSDKNRQERERYGWDHEHDTIDSYYSRIVLQTKCTLILRRRLLEISFESRQHDMTTRILWKGFRKKVGSFMSPVGLIGTRSVINWSFITTKKMKSSNLQWLQNLAVDLHANLKLNSSKDSSNGRLLAHI